MNDNTNAVLSGLLANILEVLTDSRERAYERGDTKAGSELGRHMNILGGAITEIGALSTEEHNAIVEAPYRKREEWEIVHTLPDNIRSIQRTIYNAGTTGKAPAFYTRPAPDGLPDDATVNQLRDAWIAAGPRSHELPPDRGIAADLITARLTILRAVDGHDADLPAAAAMLQRAIDRLDTNTP